MDTDKHRLEKKIGVTQWFMEASCGTNSNLCHLRESVVL